MASEWGIRYKSRLVAKKFTQRERIDYNEIFSPVVKYTSIRILLSMVAYKGLKLEQMDVKIAFLHGKLKEDMYMSQPESNENLKQKDLVSKLNKSLYGLKQSLRCWQKRFDDFTIGINFKISKYNPCVYLREYLNGENIYLLLYIDNLLIVGKDVEEINKFKQLLFKEFEMKDLGTTRKIPRHENHQKQIHMRAICLSK